jgi:hypothetical protein
VAVSYGRSDAFLVGAGIIVVAFLVALVGIRPARRPPVPSAMELAEEMQPLLLSE